MIELGPHYPRKIRLIALCSVWHPLTCHSQGKGRYRPIGCKWVFKTKHNAKGQVERYKARLKAKGYSQRGSIDFKETLSPVSTKDSLRIIMAIVAHFDLEFHHMDVRTTFFNGDLVEDVYILKTWLM